MKKRVLAMVFAAVLLLAAGCTGNDDPTADSQLKTEDHSETETEDQADIEGKFAVGYGRVNITPEESVPLAGAGNTSQRMSKGVLSFIYTTCIAFTDEAGETVLIFTNDLLISAEQVIRQARQDISDATGVPFDHILVSATHSHNAPDLDNTNESSIIRYHVSLRKWMTRAAKLAMADRKPAALYKGSAHTENLNFVRHYMTESGVAIGDNFDYGVNSPITGHTHDVDNEMQLIKITREGGKDIVLANYQVHPHRASSIADPWHYEVTADIVGVMRDKIEDDTECLFAYFTGAAGNVNPTSRIASENVTQNYLEQGKALARAAIGALPDLQAAASGRIAVTKETMVGTVDHSEDYKVANAREVAAEWSAKNDMAAALALAKKYGINSPYHANGIVSKASLPETLNIDIYAFTIGSIAFISGPYEMFDTNGMYIKKQSPFEMTFILMLCNENFTYIPSEEGYDINCYEVNLGKFIRGTGEALADRYVEMLKTLSQDR